ncbi:hypothetical protein AgCh_002495 [Apium graveolens]
MQDGLEIVNFFNGKKLLITGATGLFAKVLVEKILRSTPEVDKIFLLMKAENEDATMGRLMNEIINTELFKCLREKHAVSFESFIMSKLVPIVGNMRETNVGIQENVANSIAREVDIIIHSTASTEFDGRLGLRDWASQDWWCAGLVFPGAAWSYESQTSPSRSSEFELFLPSSPEFAEFSESGLRLLSLAGVELFLPPSPECAEFSESGLSPEYAEFSESGLRWLPLAGVELFLPPSPEFAEFSVSGLRLLPFAGVELFLLPSPEYAEFSESGLRFMVRTKALAKAFISCYPGPSSSDSEYSGNSERIEMGKKASTSDSEAITKLSVAKISSRKSEEIEDSFYYRSIRSGYARQQNAGPGAYDREVFDWKFANSIVAKEHYELKDEYAELGFKAQDSAVRAAFQLDPRIEWRWPTPDERAHHRPTDGFFPVWLEHLWSGWNPHWHLFLKHLCKYEYKISLMQITPNGIKWITWFIAACNQFKVQPTFKLWHHIFHLVRSSQFPLYELRFRAPECGYGGSYRLVIQQSSLKFWNGELIMLRGLDLHYLPHIASEGVRTRFRRDVVRGDALRLIFAFCESLGFQMTRDTFMNHRTLHRLGYEFKRSEEYDRALANAGALEIARCWLVAERHIKTNPEADWDSFVSEFIKAKEEIELGLGAPEPFDGPCPSFIPPSAPDS